MEEVDILLINGTIITMNSTREVIENGAIAVKGNLIHDIGNSKYITERYQAKKIINASRKAIMPGLIDTHGHSGHSMIKNAGTHLDGFGWRTMVDHVYFRSATEDFWFADGMLSALERLKFGTTYGVSMLGSAPRSDSPRYGQRFIDGVMEIGIRTMTCIGPPRAPWPRTFTDWKEGKRFDKQVTQETCFETTEQIIQDAHNSHNGKVNVWVSASRFSMPSPYDPMFDESHLPDALKLASRMREIANKYHVGMHTHAYAGVIASLNNYLPEVLGPDLLLAHCTGMTEEELDIMLASGVKVAHCPTTGRMYEYDASVPVVEMIDKGIVVGLGTDGSSSNSYDMFKDMCAAQFHQRMRFTDKWMLPPGKTLEMATIDGAKAVGLEDKIGSLETGKEADIIAIDLVKPHLTPAVMIPYLLTNEANGSDVDTVLVQGKILMENYDVKTVNEREVIDFAEKEAQKAVELSGIEPLMQLPEHFWGHSRY